MDAPRFMVPVTIKLESCVVIMKVLDVTQRTQNILIALIIIRTKQQLKNVVK